MPDGTWKKSDVRCPFYFHDSYRGKTIECEGVFDRSRTITRFRRQRDREQQLTLFCAACYRNCEIYRAIMQAKYPEE